MSTGNAIELTRDLIRLNAEKAKLDQEIKSLSLLIDQKKESLQHNRHLLELAKDKPMTNNEKIAFNRYTDRVNEEANALEGLITRNTELNVKKVELIGKIALTQTALKLTLDDQKYKIKDSSVHLNDPLRTTADAIADEFYSKQHKQIVITDGVRRPEDQASAMYTKMKLGENPVSLYANKDAAKEIKKAYDAHKTESSSDAIKAITAVIEAQIHKGVYISKHLRGAGLDIRDKDLSKTEKSTLETIIRQYKELSLLKEGKPPHFHVEVAANKLKVESAPVDQSKAENSGPKMR